MNILSDNRNHKRVNSPNVLSHLAPKLHRGAPLLPRCCWFIEPAPGCDPGETAPFVQTSSDVYKSSTGRWQIKRYGRIEKEYFFETVLSRRVLPFSVLEQDLLFLPVVAMENGAILLESATLVARGTLYAAAFVKETEQIWHFLCRDRQKTLYETIDSDRALSIQDPHRNVVLVFRPGLNSAAALLVQSAGADSRAASGFIADHETYYCYPETEEEGDYLCGVLNALRGEKTIGLVGAAEVPGPQKRLGVLLNPDLIPAYDSANPDHMRLAALAHECRFVGEKLIQRYREKPKNIRHALMQAHKKQLSVMSQIVKSAILPN